MAERPIVVKQDPQTAECVWAAQRGEPTGFADLYQTYYPFLLRVCKSLVQHPQDAEDCAQSSFIRVLQHTKNFRHDALFTTWLWKIAVNETRMHRRKIIYGKPTKGVVTVYNQDQDMSLDIPRALAALPISWRAVFELRLEGHSHKEIATLSRCSVGTSKMRLKLAIRRMRTFVQGGARNDQSRLS